MTLIMMPPSSCYGFKILELKYTEDSCDPHYIYFKEHSVRDPSKARPPGRTLFIINIAPYVNAEGLKRAFSEAGNITAVHFHAKPFSEEIIEQNSKDYFAINTLATFKVAFIVFEKVSEVDNALKLKKLLPLYDDETKPKTGLLKWVEQYNNSVPFTKALKKEIDEFMKQHDEKCEENAKKEKELEQEDDEGWVTVTKRGNVSSFARSENVESKIMKKEELGKKKKELKNFYTFQIRESKMKHIVALRQKFEEDKKKIAQIKQSRRFKPF